MIIFLGVSDEATLTGGAGSDTFVFQAYLDTDVVKDFDPNEGDKLSLLEYGDFYFKKETAELNGNSFSIEVWKNTSTNSSLGLNEGGTNVSIGIKLITFGMEQEDFAFNLDQILSATKVNSSPRLLTATTISVDEDTISDSINFDSFDLDQDDILQYSFSDPLKGEISILNKSTYTYMPDSNVNGNDSFTITVSDGTVDTTQIVNVTINAVNDAPVLTTASSFATDEDTLSSAMNFAYSDVDGDELTYSFSDPAKGSLSYNDNGTYTYTPDSNVNGNDSFTITVSDGTVDTTQIVNVTINAVNDAPIRNNLITLPAQNEDTIFELSLSDLLTNFSDPDGDDLNIQNIRSNDATVSNSAVDTVSIDTNANFTGDLKIEFDVVDDSGSSLASSAVINILDKPDIHIAIFDDFGSEAASQQNISLFDYTADYTWGWESSYAVDSLDQLLDISLPTNVSTEDIKGFGASLDSGGSR